MFSGLEELSREKMLEIMRMFASNTMTIDGLYFIYLEEKYGLEEATRIDTEVWRQFGPIEAKRIKKTLAINGDDLEALAKILNFQTWVQAIGFEYEIQEVNREKVIFNVTNCRPQRARVKNNRGEFNCKPVGIAYFGEFAKAINPRIKMKCLLCPPDKHPDNLWCSWEFSLD
ncbi:hypothetical protein HX99_02790 [Peptococcaceae bacterium SCADC1_2_3]|jgi:hypothetical protein|nr:hypothetical protein DK28_0205830 [Peptococcaceae bacterium SCADC1_2_3]HBQ28633.1 hypothetical protein [Desulfotomaculum sp.]KFI35689.1 hypothetical protein HY00_02335 [Peptococcaceae bacterium SCADC1_2_3]KFI36643.1 hypothetical protein HX99_02790 [Peptococcaceae bacterium SCADC1_2_3]KFI37414.1 hypothetical protein HY02_07140 [Peptococcaceae bacterium SCADC1_2_3]